MIYWSSRSIVRDVMERFNLSIDVENEQARCKMVAPPRLGSPDLILADVIFGTIEILHEWVFQFEYLNGDC